MPKPHSTTWTAENNTSHYLQEINSIHIASQKRPTFTTCCDFYIHSSIATIFGINVAEKVGNQNVLYIPTTPN